MIGLLADLQNELALALNSLGGKESQGLHDHYEVYMSGYVNRAAEGFVFLRTAGRVDSSKLLVRPAMEAAIRLLAIRKQPPLLYRIAFSEHQSDSAWLRALGDQAGGAFNEADFQKQWSEFKQKYIEQFPQYPPVDKPIGIESLAQKAGIGGYYHSHYRTYCKHAHGTIRAVRGFLDDLTDREDTRAMSWSVFAALEGLPRLGAESRNLELLRTRLATLDTQLPG